jgi:hypothetical protein
VTLTALTLVVTVLDPKRISFGSPAIPNHTGIAGAGAAIDLFAGICYLAGVLLIGLTIGGLVVRARRALLREQQQIKLLGYAAALTIASLAVVLAVSFFVSERVTDSLWDAAVTVGFGIAVPAACGFAILRRGLFEIDRLISRTISYAIVTGLLVGTFLGIVVLATRVLPFSSPVAVAASTLAAAALFNRFACGCSAWSTGASTGRALRRRGDGGGVHGPGSARGRPRHDRRRARAGRGAGDRARARVGLDQIVVTDGRHEMFTES